MYYFQIKKMKNKNKQYKRKSNFIYSILKKTWELIKIIFSIWEKRISWRKYFFLFIIGIIILFTVFYKWVWKLFSTLWIDISFTSHWVYLWNDEIIFIIWIILFLFYDLLLSIKRGHDLWSSRPPCYGHYTDKWQNYRNKYWEKTSFIKKIKKWRITKY